MSPLRRRDCTAWFPACCCKARIGWGSAETDGEGLARLGPVLLCPRPFAVSNAASMPNPVSFQCSSDPFARQIVVLLEIGARGQLAEFLQLAGRGENEVFHANFVAFFGG